MVLILYQDQFFMVYIFLYIRISLLFHLRPANLKTLMDYTCLALPSPPLNLHPLRHFRLAYDSRIRIQQVQKAQGGYHRWQDRLAIGHSQVGRGLAHQFGRCHYSRD